MRPELLSPAGSPEALRAAVQNGADAMYLGWGDFNARRNAKNFSDEEFTAALLYCHERGVKVYLTLNTLLTDRELPLAWQTARRASELGVDAVLVQDWGLLETLTQSLPDLPLHASTQMSLFTSGGACEAAGAGLKRIVIARECSRSDTAAICQNCPAEIEVFVHGALCMCYSGQCAMSALIGGRSGNRGKCAQPCRLPYGVDGSTRNHYPLSLKDNSLAGELEDLENIGVTCLKLEGRMKRPEYVAVVTGIYARLLREHRRPTPQELTQLEQSFSRSGFTDGYWQGRRGPAMFGIRPESVAEPTELFAATKAAYERDHLRTVPVWFTCSIRAHNPVTLTAQDDAGHSVTVAGSTPEAARTRAVTAEEIAQRLCKTGGTAYACANPRVEVEGGLSLSAAAINALRRDALSALSACRTAPPSRRVFPFPPPPAGVNIPQALALTVSVAQAGQITPELLAYRPARVYLPLEQCASLPTLSQTKTEWCAVLPRVWRDGDEPRLRELLQQAKEQGVTGALLGNLGHLPLTQDMGLHLYGDFGFNVFNSRSLSFLAQRGLLSATVSFELRGAQIRDLQKALPTEAIIYGRLPLMVTENCLIQNAQGCPQSGSGATIPCHGPCQHAHALIDRTGAAFPLLPLWGHRTEVENSKPVYLADREDWKHLGLSYARLRFTTESPETCVSLFREYLVGGKPPAAFTRGLFDRGVE